MDARKFLDYKLDRVDSAATAFQEEEVNIMEIFKTYIPVEEELLKQKKKKERRMVG